MSTHSEIAARCNFPRLPLHAFLIELYGKSRDDEKEESTKYVIAVYTGDYKIIPNGNGITRPFDSLEELQMNLDMRWPSNFIDKIDSKPILGKDADVITSMHQIRGIPQEDLLECYHSRKSLV